jgi:anti-sigma regulatory factor (Ser/Thr protein kinase)
MFSHPEFAVQHANRAETVVLKQIRVQAVLVALVPVLVLASILGFALRTRGTTSDTAYWAAHTRSVLSASDAYIAAFTAENDAAATYRRDHDRADSAAFRRGQARVKATTLRLVAAGKASQAERAQVQSLLATGRDADAVLERYVNALRAGDNARAKRIAQAVATTKIGLQLHARWEALQNGERETALVKLETFNDVVRHFSQVLTFSLVAGMLLFLAVALALGTRVGMRLRSLRENAERLRRGENPSPLAGDDEFAVADREYRAVLERWREEHNNATLLQRALLPQRLPSVPGIRIDASYAPSSNQSVIGGDWYDVFPLGDGRLGISVGDVAGHGLHAATTMALMRQSVRTAARLSDGPAHVLQSVNRIAYDDNTPLVTIFYGELSLATGVLRYAVAGHPTPITVRASGDVEQMNGAGLIMGVDRRVEYEEYETLLDAGSGIVLFTDGLVEEDCRDGRDYAAGMARLIDVVNRQYYSATENIAHAIQRDVLNGRAPQDDAAVLFIGITDLGMPRAASSRTWKIQATQPSAARRAKRAFLWYLGEFADEGSDLSESELIFGELVGNVARHTPGVAEITLEIAGSRAYLHICDEGKPIARAAGGPDAFAESGRGLLLVESLAHSLTIERTPRGNRIIAELPLTLDRDDAVLELHQQSDRLLRARVVEIHREFAQNRRH